MGMMPALPWGKQVWAMGCVTAGWGADRGASLLRWTFPTHRMIQEPSPPLSLFLEETFGGAPNPHELLFLMTLFPIAQKKTRRWIQGEDDHTNTLHTHTPTHTHSLTEPPTHPSFLINFQCCMCSHGGRSASPCPKCSLRGIFSGRPQEKPWPDLRVGGCGH